MRAFSRAYLLVPAGCRLLQNIRLMIADSRQHYALLKTFHTMLLYPGAYQLILNRLLFTTSTHRHRRRYELQAIFKNCTCQQHLPKTLIGGGGDIFGDRRR